MNRNPSYAANRTGTRRMPRNNNLQGSPRIFNQPQSQPQGPPSSSARVTVQKLG